MPINFLRRPGGGAPGALAAAVGTAAVGICVYRAATQSISHDEARSFLLFIQGPWRNAFAPSGANHLLLVVVSRAVLWLLPVSELTLRLPTVGGAVVYGLASAWLLRRFVADPWLRTAILALMTMNPYVLDFFSVARGYGIMLACLLAAICLLIPTADRELSKRRAIAGGMLLGLATTAHLVGLFPSVGMVAACTLVGAASRDWRRGAGRAALVAAAGTATAVPLLAPQLLRPHTTDYYLGAASIQLWAGSLTRGAWSHGDPHVAALADLTSTERLISGVAVAAFVGAVGLAGWYAAHSHRAQPAQRALVWTAIVMTVMGAAAVAGHVIADLPYPEGRTAIYWIPILTFAFALMASTTRRGTLTWLGCWLLIAATLVNTAARLQVSRYADWSYDAANREIIARIAADRGGSAAPSRIGGSWQFEPSLNFYRVVRHLDWMQPVYRRAPARGDDYYVLLREDTGLIDDFDLRVLYRDPGSGTTLAAPRAGQH